MPGHLKPPPVSLLVDVVCTFPCISAAWLPSADVSTSVSCLVSVISCPLVLTSRLTVPSEIYTFGSGSAVQIACHPHLYGLDLLQPDRPFAFGLPPRGSAHHHLSIHRGNNVSYKNSLLTACLEPTPELDSPFHWGH